MVAEDALFQDRVSQSSPNVMEHNFFFQTIIPAGHEWGEWPWDINPSPEGRVEVCYVPPPGVPSQLCTGAAEAADFIRICLSL